MQTISTRTTLLLDATKISQKRIPYNYSSYTYNDIVLHYLGKRGLELVELLAPQIETGISARMLGEILGDMWIIKRNPFIQEDLLTSNKRRKELIDAIQHRLQQMKKRAVGNPLSNELIEISDKAVTTFATWLHGYQQYRTAIIKQLERIADKGNVDFSPYARVSATTDATDLRMALPLAVLYPDKEEELPQIILLCKKLHLTIIPQGGATGYHGGVIPLHEDTVVINLEKFTFKGKVSNRLINDTQVATIEVGAGLVTQRVSETAQEHGLVFAVDPTSQDASTIGGNIATNAGGKKALLWGTTLDNLLSWKMIMADGNFINVERINHNLSKIHEQETVTFKIKKTTPEGRELEGDSISIDGSSIRKAGLGKDVTNKYLFGIPGIQKEGCDGIITSAVFVLHKCFAFTQTVCLEFYSKNLEESVDCIVEIKKMVDEMKDVHLSALEHLDDYYLSAIEYSTKIEEPIAGTHGPNMLLLIDVCGNNLKKVEDACSKITKISTPHNAFAFIATTSFERQRFWEDRKRTAAIAKHTNAFKLNEDVVIPLPMLSEYAKKIAEINQTLVVNNKLKIIQAIVSFMKKCNKDDTVDSNKFYHSYAHIDKVITTMKTGEKISIKKDIIGYIKNNFNGARYEKLLEQIKAIHSGIIKQRLFVALHMHAGDGNVHSNIPVNSDMPEMMEEARAVVKKIMNIAKELGGVISGEHGIGITKAEYLSTADIDSFKAYKNSIDPESVFNRGKLIRKNSIEEFFTPSFGLLEQEALILEESDLGELNVMIKNCLRCGKCKPVCATHVPTANLLYSPRNKIIATSALIESFLYEEQTRRGVSVHHFSSLLNVADHCTVCHKCANPCPVNIDFGDVTMLLRKILRNNGHYPRRILSWITITYLNMRHTRTINIAYGSVIRYAMMAQNIMSKILHAMPIIGKSLVKMKNKPQSTTKAPSLPLQVIHFVSRPLPNKIPVKPMRALLGVDDTNYIPIFRKPESKNAEAVFYFPGCGSERLFSKIGMATIAVLYEMGVQVVLPPGYICCGYPQRASGYLDKSQKITTENKVLFHRVVNSLAYLSINQVIVSCGTCFDQLERYKLDSIFTETQLIDIHEYVFSKVEFRNKYKEQLESTTGQLYIYHDPCHSPIKNNDPLQLTKELLASDQVALTDRCCGESGSFAMERPDIATQVRKSKAESLKVATSGNQSTANKPAKILTSCPACQQGLLRFKDETGMDTDYLIVEFVEKIWGADWQNDFISRVQNEQGLEKVLL